MQQSPLPTDQESPRQSDRPRASAAVIDRVTRTILMVQHRRYNGTTYWQLPGGGLKPGEQTHEAALRELCEETGLTGSIIRWLFTIPYKYGMSSTFLVAVDPSMQPILGYDPEDVLAEHRKLIAVSWKSIDDMRGNPEIEAFTQVMELEPLL